MNKNTNNKNEKKESPITIIIFIGLLLVAIGIPAIFLKDNKKDDKEDIITLRKILPEELNNNTAKEILQYGHDTMLKKENWEVVNASLYATNDLNGFVINYEAKNNTGTWYKQTIITYKNGTWTIDLPGWAEGEKDISSYGTFYGHEE